VERLASGDEIHAGILERRGLRRPGDAREAGVVAEPALARTPHLPVRLDAEDAVAVLQKHLAQDARAGAHVGDYGGAREPASCLEEVEDRSRVRGTVPRVVIHPVREAPRRVVHLRRG
jgi:hypothetical protein